MLMDMADEKNDHLSYIRGSLTSASWHNKTRMTFSRRSGVP